MQKKIPGGGDIEMHPQGIQGSKVSNEPLAKRPGEIIGIIGIYIWNYSVASRFISKFKKRNISCLNILFTCGRD